MGLAHRYLSRVRTRTCVPSTLQIVNLRAPSKHLSLNWLINFLLVCVLRYISILVELTRLEGTRHGHLIASQMLDVAIRVKAIRVFAVAQMAMLLDNAHLLTGNMQRNGICEVLYAAAWICGEFSEYVTF